MTSKNSRRFTWLDPAFDAEVYDYGAIARASADEPAPAFPLIKTAVPGWDNDPRRQGAGTVLHGATPALFQAWVEDLIRFARRHPVEGEALVCINAWNEWAEGRHAGAGRALGGRVPQCRIPGGGRAARAGRAGPHPAGGP